jgi:hypothetical protein
VTPSDGRCTKLRSLVSCFASEARLNYPTVKDAVFLNQRVSYGPQLHTTDSLCDSHRVCVKIEYNSEKLNIVFRGGSVT